MLRAPLGSGADEAGDLFAVSQRNGPAATNGLEHQGKRGHEWASFGGPRSAAW
jgi:hypothetical protein